ncbi:hypothetical protein QJS66_01725 [Kocuria rhizophila]|nr:hypothetical protein QJS66_01725 [Kocuria rhizophila]
MDRQGWTRRHPWRARRGVSEDPLPLFSVAVPRRVAATAAALAAALFRRRPLSELAEPCSDACRTLASALRVLAGRVLAPAPPRRRPASSSSWEEAAATFANAVRLVPACCWSSAPPRSVGPGLVLRLVLLLASACARCGCRRGGPARWPWSDP